MCIVRAGRLLGLLVLAGIIAGCPYAPAPDYQNALIVSPQTLDFGATATTKTFTVKKVWSSRPIPPFQITVDKPWVSVSPTSGNSTGPFDPVTVNVTINRTNMTTGVNTATITIASEGVIPKYVTVTARVPLRVDFRAEPTTAFEGDPIQFTDLSVEETVGKAITSWQWDFGDGNQSEDQNPEHTYTTAGTYTVALTVSTGVFTASLTKTNYITIQSVAPSANFIGAPRTVFDGEPVTFTDLSTPGKGDISEWEWDFGDGNQSTEQNPVHIYQATVAYDRAYTVSLRVASEFGEDTEVKTDYITVRPKPPTANFVGTPRTVTSGESVQFTDLSDPGSFPITQWEWNFGDNTTGPERFDQNPSHIYQATTQYATSYTVSLTVRTAVGNDNEIKLNYITVQPATKNSASSLPADNTNGKPVNSASLSGFSVAYPWDAPNKWFLVGEPVAFLNQSIVGKDPLSFLWNFGDGTVSTEVNPVHAYRKPSENKPYVVTLTSVSATTVNQYVDESGVNVFSPAPLDEFLQTSRAGYISGVQDAQTYSYDKVQTYLWTLTSQLLQAESSDPVPVKHDMLLVLPAATQTATCTLLVFETPISAHLAEEIKDLAQATGSPTCAVFPKGSLPESTFAGVAAIVRAMDAVQELLNGDAPESFVLIGQGKCGWWTWLAAATDKRVSGVNKLPEVEPPSDVDDFAGYMERVQVINPNVTNQNTPTVTE